MFLLLLVRCTVSRIGYYCRTDRHLLPYNTLGHLSLYTHLVITVRLRLLLLVLVGYWEVSEVTVTYLQHELLYIVTQ